MKVAKHPSLIFRIGRINPWKIRPPRGNNRFDISDPEQPVMTLYTGESKDAAFAEVLAPFRPDLETITAINSIRSDDDAEPASRIVPKRWLETRRIGSARIRGKATIVDITALESIAELRNQALIAEKANACGFSDIDESSLRAAGDHGRTFTQTVAAYLYNLNYSGIRYGSRLGGEHYCIAGFVSLFCSNITESDFIATIGPTEKISVSDPSLRKVAKIFGLRV